MRAMVMVRVTMMMMVMMVLMMAMLMMMMKVVMMMMAINGDDDFQRGLGTTHVKEHVLKPKTNTSEHLHQ